MVAAAHWHAGIDLPLTFQRPETGGALVIDRGAWREREALTRAVAVLITHEHADHVDLDRLVRLGATIYVPAEADIEVLDAVKVTSGEEFTAAGFTGRLPPRPRATS